MPYTHSGQFLKKSDKTINLDDAVAARGRNVLNILAISVTFLAAILGFLMEEYLLAGIALGSSILFLIFHFTLLRSLKIRIWSILTIVVITVDSVIAFYYTGEFSKTLLFFILLYPIAVLKIVNSKNLLLVVPLLLLIIIGNYISFGRNYTPLTTAELVTFSIAYIVIAISIKYFYHILFENIIRFMQRADHFEKEIAVARLRRRFALGDQCPDALLRGFSRFGAGYQQWQ